MTLAEFKTAIKYRLGYPVVQIELAPQQFDLAIEEAIKFYQRNHFDGSYQMYMPIQIDSTIAAQKYVELGPDIIGVNNMFDMMSSGTGLLTTDFIVSADAAWNAFRANSSLSGFYNMMSYRSLIQQTFTGKTPIRFNYNRGKCFIDAGSSKLSIGSWIVLDVVAAIDPAEDERMFEDPWLNEYAEACVKRIWGQTLKKYQQVQLPGGITLDGQTMYSEATETKQKLEDEIISNWQLPIPFLVG